MTVNTSTSNAAPMSSTSKNLASCGVIMQNYCNSVLQQPQVDFSAFPELKTDQDNINTGLTNASTHADNFLDSIQPAIISNFVNIQNFYNLYSAVPTSTPGNDVHSWINNITALWQQAKIYQTQSSSLVTSLQTLSVQISNDASNFATAVSDLNTAVEGDDGELASISTQLSRINSQIDGTIAGNVTSALGIVGAVLTIIVGSVADFVTAGTSTPMVIGGCVALASGIGGETAAAINLNGLYQQKASLLINQSTLHAEVNLAAGIQSAYQSLATNAQNAFNAATLMQTAWSTLDNTLSSTISDLQGGMLSTDSLRAIFVSNINTDVAALLNELTVVQQQLSGIQISTAPNGQTVGQFGVDTARQQTAAV